MRIGLVLLAACGSSQVAKPPHVTPKPDAGILDAAVIEAGPSKLERLAAQHDHLAPGMREALRREIDPSKETSVTMPAFETDTCIRVAIDADARTQVTLENAQALMLGSLDKTEGAIGPSGPVCFRKGDIAMLRFSGQSVVRLVVWASP